MSKRIGLKSAGGILLILVIGLSIWWFLIRDQRYGGWTEVASEQIEQCEAESCVELVPLVLPHTGTVSFRYYPILEDGVTEWAGCIQALLNCAAKDDISGCLVVPQCPAECMQRLADIEGITTSHENLFDGIEEEFLADAAYCGVPHE